MTLKKLPAFRNDNLRLSMLSVCVLICLVKQSKRLSVWVFDCLRD